MNPIISVNTLAYEGYDLTTALQELAKIGVSHVELGYTRGFTEGLSESHFTKDAADTINYILSDLGLSSVALSAHIDLTTEDSVDELKRRIEFGKRLGVKVVNTKVGATSGRARFEKNISCLADFAQSMEVIIGLENPAEGTDQIITSGEAGAKVVRAINSNFVKLNYDFGNAYTYSKGMVDPASDYKNALPHACYLHLKDMKKIENGWGFSQIGEGVIDYSRIFKDLVESGILLPLSIEQLFLYQASEDFIVSRLQNPLPLASINSGLRGSVDYVDGLIKKFTSASPLKNEDSLSA